MESIQILEERITGFENSIQSLKEFIERTTVSINHLSELKQEAEDKMKIHDALHKELLFIYNQLSAKVEPTSQQEINSN